jgi:AcrR family transcriptional regulator/DNA-binding MarR family transcriptional regulator
MAAAEVCHTRGSETRVSELQRARLLCATFALIGERGYEGVSARSVSERAGVSNRTFYEAFSDREDCFLAAFDHAVEDLELVLRPVYESEDEWVAKVRAGLAALLETLEREPLVRRLVFVEALRAGPRVLARRALVLEALAGVIDEGRADGEAPAELPALTATAVVGATFGVIHARLLEPGPEPLSELLGALMATIVLPYRGSAAAARELERPAPEISTRAPRRQGGLFGRPLGSASPVDYRLTVRTQMALAAVAGQPDLNNREVSELIGLADQGQISRMMKRLQEQGLVEDTHSNPHRIARAWRLTPQGEAVIDAHRPLQRQRLRTRGGGKLAAPRRLKRPAPNASQFAPIGLPMRVTYRTSRVLSAIGEHPGASNGEIAEHAGVADQGQISKLLARLQRLELLQNTGNSQSRGERNAWNLTPLGENVTQQLALTNIDGEGEKDR